MAQHQEKPPRNHHASVCQTTWTIQFRTGAVCSRYTLSKNNNLYKQFKGTRLMAILLVHLRRIILLLSIVYLGGAFVRRLLTDSRRAHLQQLRKNLYPKHLHVQIWAYIYTGYAYVVFANYLHERNFTNLIEFRSNLT